MPSALILIADGTEEIEFVIPSDGKLHIRLSLHQHMSQELGNIEYLLLPLFFKAIVYPDRFKFSLLNHVPQGSMNSISNNSLSFELCFPFCAERMNDAAFLHYTFSPIPYSIIASRSQFSHSPAILH